MGEMSCLLVLDGLVVTKALAGGEYLTYQEHSEPAEGDGPRTQGHVEDVVLRGHVWVRRGTCVRGSDYPSRSLLVKRESNSIPRSSSASLAPASRSMTQSACSTSKRYLSK